MATYQQKMRELGLGDGNGVNLAERVGNSAASGATPTGRIIPESDPRNRASPGY